MSIAVTRTAPAGSRHDLLLATARRMASVKPAALPAVAAVVSPTAPASPSLDAAAIAQKWNTTPRTPLAAASIRLASATPANRAIDHTAIRARFNSRNAKIPAPDQQEKSR